MKNVIHKVGGQTIVKIRNFLPSVGGTTDYLKGQFLLQIACFLLNENK